MIAFTVMDHDVLTANDFAGEAFLALANIPGVADYSTSIDNFHGLKQVDLPLMQQNDKSMINFYMVNRFKIDKNFVFFFFRFQIIQFYKFWNLVPPTSKLQTLCANKRLV